jgi:hypothetical protein
VCELFEAEINPLFFAYRMAEEDGPHLSRMQTRTQQRRTETPAGRTHGPRYLAQVDKAHVSNPGLLRPRQLCDLLNYVLGRPIRGKTYEVVPRINVCVVQSWDAGYQQASVERWCDARLEEAGVIPKRVRRGHKIQAPRILEQFIAEQQAWMRP